MPRQPNERRRFGRLPVRMPVVLRGCDAAGREFFDRAEIVSIDERGARAQTRFQLQTGAEVTVELPAKDRPRRMRVVWSAEAASFYEGMVGLEFVDADDSWDLESLRLRWGIRNY
ncbi:MAG: PilZ domain-containing protein [Acidobacteriia bacterium]|nr:PilZ domain-containing protein [Terriglobia bacterium]